MGIRSFLAFELPEDIMSVVSRVSQALRQTTLDVKWVKVNNIHLTLVFLGDIHPDAVGPIKHEMGRVCEIHGPFTLSLSGMGCFPNKRRPRVLWAGLRGDLERLTRFRDALQEPLKVFGVKEEKRPFRPHLTLGRFRKHGNRETMLEDLLREYQDIESPECRVGRLTFFKSTLNPGGAIYTQLASWPLEGGASE